METLKRMGGTAGLLIVVIGAAVTWFAPQHRVWGWILMGAGFLPLLVSVWLNRDDLLNASKGRPFRHGANAVFYSLMVLGIVGAVDFLAARHNHRFDLTESERHSISQQTVQILQSLDKEATEITFIGVFSPTLGPAKQKAIDLMEEYRYHDPRITVKTIDPFRSPAEARAYGVEEDGTVIVSTKAGEARVTPSRDGGLTEENLTNALIKATAAGRKVICVTTGHGEKQIAEASPGGFQQATEALKKENFDVREVKLLESGNVPADCSSILVPGATHPFLPPEAEALDRYLGQGGRALVLIEPETTSGLEELLLRYGLKPDSNVILSVDPIARVMGASAEMAVVYDYGSHLITRDLENLATVFPMARSIETVSPAEPGVTTEVLARTGERSWGETGDLRSPVGYDEGADKAGPLIVGAAAVRKESAAPAADPNAGKVPEKETRLVLFGDSDYAANSGFTMGGNRDLFLNTVAWLNERTDLISIRPKSSTPQPVVMTELQARLLKWYSLALGPLVVIIIGIGVFLRRRRL